MNHKVLLADDSLTIQKVIKITLAQQPYDITDCSSEEELFHKLADVQPKIVFLDFNLSEKFTGYELTTKIKSIVPGAKVLLLLGTFDSVDEAAMEKCGASDKIVKPFDSKKFIAVCKHLVDSFVSDEDLEYPTLSTREEESAPQVEEQWTMKHSVEVKEAPIEKTLDNSFPETMNILEQSVLDWGISVPGVINQKPPIEKIDLPPVMQTKKSSGPDATRDDIRFPISDDLDYPDMGSPISHEPLPAAVPEVAAKKPAYVSIADFAPVEMVEDPAPLEMEGSYVPDDSNVKEIEAAIQDEVADDLWQVDEFEDLKREVASKFEDAKNNFQPTRNDFDESLFGDNDRDAIKWSENTNAFTAAQKKDATASYSLDMKSEMEAMVKKYVQEYMDQMFQKSVEKVSWEIIPDLAENLIRQELSKISSKIMRDE